jgi:outer membrane protein assembly factor BamD (BamD/ComL family)
MRGLCYLEKMPEDHFILPPAESREMDDVMNAHANFAAVVDQHPHSLYALRAKPMLIRTVDRRCRQHLYVARYYEKAGKPSGVVQRIRQALRLEEKERASRHIPDSFQCAATTSTLLSLARAYHQIRDLQGLHYVREVYVQHQRRFDQPAKGLAELDTLIRKLEAEPQSTPK